MGITLTCNRHPDVQLVVGEKKNLAGSTRTVWACPEARCGYFIEVPEHVRLTEMGMPTLPLFGAEAAGA